MCDSDSECYFSEFSPGGSNRKRRETMYYDCLDYTPTPNPTTKRDLNFTEDEDAMKTSEECEVAQVLIQEIVKTPDFTEDKMKINEGEVHQVLIQEVVKTPSQAKIQLKAVQKIQSKSKIPKLIGSSSAAAGAPKPKLDQDMNSTPYPFQNKLHQNRTVVRKVEEKMSATFVSTPVEPKKVKHFCCK